MKSNKMIIEIADKTRSKPNTALVKNVISKLLVHYKLQSKTVSLVFIGDSLMTKLNKKWRGKNKPTDILSFAAIDEKEAEENYLGELIIDYQQIKRQAPKFRQTIKKELVYIVVHGFLHLVGYDDKKDKEALKMKLLGEALIEKLKLYKI